MNILNQWGVAKYARSCAARANLGVVWIGEERPSCDGNSIYLPAISDKTSDVEVAKLLHYVAHEVGHILYSDFNVVNGAGIKQESLTMFVWNVLEDHRVNYLNALNYEGDKNNDDVHYASTASKFISNVLKNDPKLAALCAWEIGVHGDYAPLLSTVPLPKVDEGEYDRVSAFTEELRTIRTIENPTEGTKATLALAKKLVNEEKDKETSKGEKEEPSEEPSEEGDEGEESSEGTPKEGTKEPKEGKPKEGKGEEKEEGKEEGKPKPKVVKYEELTGEPSIKRGKPSATKIIYPSKKSGGGYILTPLECLEIIDYTKGQPTESNVGRPLMGASAYSSGVARLASKAHKHTSLANKVRTKLQIMSRSRTSYAQKKGKLHGAGLHRLMVKDGGGYSERIFKTTVESSVLDVSVLLLVDTSGSMCGHKYDQAMLAASALNDVLGNILNVPTCILGFSTYQKRGHQFTSIGVFRKFAQRKVAVENILGTMSSYGEDTLADNADGEALLYSHAELMAQKTKRKVMFVLSDGSPYASRERGDPFSHTEQVVKAIEKTQCEVYGIGILDDNVERFYKNHVVLNDARDLESCLMKLLDKSLLNHL